MRAIMVSTLILAMCLAFAGTAGADFIGTFVDADPTNTGPSSAITTTSGDTDGLWLYSPNDGWLSYFFSNSTAENCPVLTTTVSGLPIGDYKVYGVFDWYPNIGGAIVMFDAHVNGQPWTGYTLANAGTATGNSNSWLVQYQYPLGIVEGVTGFTVQVDDWYLNSTFCLYDGICYEPVTLETSAPRFSPDGGNLPGPTNVVITCPTTGVTIRYTTDGSDPTETNGTVIANGGSVYVSIPMTLKAKAWGTVPSNIKSATYRFMKGTFVPATPANTTPSDAYLYTSADTDNLWWYTPNEGGLNYFFSNAIAENCPVLTTTVSGLPEATYNIYGNFNYYPNTGGGYSMFNARLNGGEWLGYTHANSGVFTGNSNSWLKEYQHLLGTLHGVTGFTVDVDDWAFQSLFCLYGGVCYEFLGYDSPTPVFTPDGGSFDTPQNVVITCSDPSATIRYTTDGSEPTETNGTVIASGGSVLVDHAMTLKARSWASGMLESPVKAAIFSFIVFADNWNDNTVFGPTKATAGVDWKVTSGLFNADALITPAGFSFVDPVSGNLMFTNSQPSRIEVDFGTMLENTTLEAHLKLRHTGTAVDDTFDFGLKDNDPASPSYGYYYEERASMDMFAYEATGDPGSTSGFHGFGAATGGGPDDWIVGPGLVHGSSLYPGTDYTNFLKMVFNNGGENSGVEIWHALDWVHSKSFDDSTLTWTKVASWANTQFLEGASQFFMSVDNPQNWMVDDLEIVGRVAALPAAVATPTITPGSMMHVASVNVTISCATDGATIRYTTDGNVPTSSTGTVIASGSSIAVSTPTVVTARAFKSGLADSTSASASYTFPTLSRPAGIPSDTATIDGDLADWSGATWAPLDQNYSGSATDIAEAYYAAKWAPTGDKVYVAVKVRDTAHKFSNAYLAWNVRDAVEIYIHTTGVVGHYSAYQQPAQQYTVGIKDSDHSQVWARLGADQPALFMSAEACRKTGMFPRCPGLMRTWRQSLWSENPRVLDLYTVRMCRRQLSPAISRDKASGFPATVSSVVLVLKTATCSG